MGWGYGDFNRGKVVDLACEGREEVAEGVDDARWVVCGLPLTKIGAVDPWEVV